MYTHIDTQRHIYLHIYTHVLKILFHSHPCDLRKSKCKQEFLTEIMTDHKFKCKTAHRKNSILSYASNVI